MKKAFFIVSLLAVILISCDKEKGDDKKENENLCPVVLAKDVPQVVKDSFNARYPIDTVETWFFKDSINYCALFTNLGVEKLSKFTTAGVFVAEESEEQEGEHEDSIVVGGVKVAPGCKCEVNDDNGKDEDH